MKKNYIARLAGNVIVANFIAMGVLCFYNLDKAPKKGDPLTDSFEYTYDSDKNKKLFNAGAHIFATSLALFLTKRKR